jgi:UDP-N-acetylglucosamine 2-epimerase (non-hydrolysing)
LQLLAQTYDRPVIVSTHPRTRARLDAGQADSGLAADERIRLLPPFGYFDYVTLQRNAYCVVSDSGTLTEEAALLGFPAVMVRDAHERPEGVDAGVLLLSALQPDQVRHAVDVVIAQRPPQGQAAQEVPDYAPAQVSRTVVRIVLGYIGYVRRTVWHQPE